LADSVGLALLVVLERLSPAERLAFVLHDMFGMPFEEIAAIVDRSPEATRQLASRARRRVRGRAPVPDADLRAQREVIEAFQAAARTGDFEAWLAGLDPDVVLRADSSGVPTGAPIEIRGAPAVARRALGFAHLDLDQRPAIINGAAGVISFRNGQPFAILGITVRGGKIVAMDIVADPERLQRLDLTVLER